METPSSGQVKAVHATLFMRVFVARWAAIKRTGTRLNSFRPGHFRIPAGDNICSSDICWATGSPGTRFGPFEHLATAMADRAKPKLSQGSSRDNSQKSRQTTLTAGLVPRRQKTARAFDLGRQTHGLSKNEYQRAVQHLLGLSRVCNRMRACVGRRFACGKGEDTTCWERMLYRLAWHQRDRDDLSSKLWLFRGEHALREIDFT